MLLSVLAGESCSYARSICSVHSFPCVAAEKQSYYQRFMADMCASARILDRVAEFGTLGGSVTQYQDDFCKRLASHELQNRYRWAQDDLPIGGH